MTLTCIALAGQIILATPDAIVALPIASGWEVTIERDGALRIETGTTSSFLRGATLVELLTLLPTCDPFAPIEDTP